jgi:hypothetical protein
MNIGSSCGVHGKMLRRKCSNTSATKIAKGDHHRTSVLVPTLSMESFFQEPGSNKPGADIILIFLRPDGMVEVRS